MKLAIRLNDSNVTNSLSFEENQKTLSYAQKAINSKDILDSLDKDTVLRYPKRHYESLTQRCFTYVSGSEAYPESSHLNVSEFL
jgi:hypothetical protein